MADKKPIRTVFNSDNVATGLAEFQTGETVGLAHGGLGAALSLGSAGQVLKVNSGASALEFGAVEAIINIDTATDLTSQTLASSDQLMVSDGGTEGRATLGQLGPAIANVPNSFFIPYFLPEICRRIHANMEKSVAPGHLVSRRI